MISSLTVLTLGLIPALSPVGPFVVPAQAASCSPSQATFAGNGTNGTSGVPYQVLAFKNTSSCEWAVPTGVSTVDLLLVGGGGGGQGLAGGGAGEFYQRSNYSVSGSVSVTAGSGGTGSGGGNSTAGGTTVFGSIQAVGGGQGGYNSDGFSGASGGGGTRGGYSGGGSTVSGAYSFGSEGGSGFGSGSPVVGGSGGGAGGAPASPVGTYGAVRTYGGAGKESTLVPASTATSLSIGEVSSSRVYFAGGGAGGCGNSGCGGAILTGGVGGGGDGSASYSPEAGRESTGGGGGGSNTYGGSGGAGGVGVVVVRYSLKPDNPTNLSISSGDGEVSIGYTAPAHAGATITDYEYQYRTYSSSTWGGWSSWQSLGETDGSSSLSLTNGILYDINIRSVNSAGHRSTGVNIGTVIPSPVGEIFRLDATHPDSYSGSGNTWTDLAGSLDGTLTSGPSYSTREKAFQFDGTDDYVDLPDIAYDFSNGLAIHAVVDFRDADNFERIIDFGNGHSSQNVFFGREGTTTRLQYVVWRDGAVTGYCYAENAIVSGFHTYSVVIDPSAGSPCAIYRDGSALSVTLATTTNFVPKSVSRTDNYIGKSNWESFGSDSTFGGSIQSVVMYNTAQTTPTCYPVQSTVTGDGSIGEDGVPYKVLQFTTAGECEWTAPTGVVEADYLVVGGGGGGGGHIAGGGGGGEVATGTESSITPGSTYKMTVGLGGVGGKRIYDATANHNSAGEGSTGQTSIVFEISGASSDTAAGGAKGQTLFSSVIGGSGGASGNGNLGGSGYTGSPDCSLAMGGGGAGAAAAGSNADATSRTAGAGGAGLTSTITGASLTYGGGGGGGINASGSTDTCYRVANTPGSGGAGGGGAGGPNIHYSVTNLDTAGIAGVANLGGGGGGASGNGSNSSSEISGGHGGSGLVVIRYSLSPGAPAVSSVASGDESVDVAFTAPSHTGGATITDYEYSLDGSSWTSLSTASAGTETVSGLTNGTAYTIRLRAVNGNGNGEVVSSSSVTPRGTQTLTWSPTNSSVALARGSVTLDPAASGLGSPSISYSVQTVGDASCSIADSSTPTVAFTSVGSCVVRATASAGAYTEATVDVTVNVYPADVPRIWTDFGGFWDSDADSTNKSDSIANVLAFEWHGTNYSTGVSDSTLDSNSVTYEAAVFQALEIDSLPDECSDASYASYYLTRGSSNTDEEAYVSGDSYRALDDVTSCPSGAELAGLLSDGVQGLDISTGVTNIPSSVSGRFALNAINTDAIDDGIPDILVTQLFSPPGTADTFYFENNGAAFNGSYDIRLGSITSLDTQFVQQLNNPDSSLTTYGTGQNRDVRVLAFELVDLLGLGDVAGNATHLVWDFSGGSDPAFIAVNEASFTRTAQTVSFGSLSDKSYGDSNFTVSATASSGLSVSFTSATTSVCTVSGSTVSIVDPGTCTIQAAQAGNLQFSAASAVSRSFTVGPKAISVNVTPAGKTYDGTQSVASFTTSLVGVESGDTVTVDDAKISVSFDAPTAGSQSATSTLTSGALGGTDAAKYTLSVGSVSNAAISKASQASLSISSANSMVYGQTIPLVATGGSGTGALSYSQVSGPCTVSGSTVTSTGAGSCVVTATRAGDDNYNSVSSSNFTITVSKANQTINFTSTVPVSAVSGTSYTPTATATSGLTPSISVTTGSPAVCTESGGVVTFVGSGTCVIAASQTGDSDYNAATSVTQTIVAGKINQTISFSSISGKDFDDAAFLAGATVSSGRTVTFATSTGSVCAVNASTGLISIKTIGDCTVTASSAGDRSYAAASNVSRTFTISPVLAGKPSVTSVSAGNSSVTVAFGAPGTNGGDSIDAYQVVATGSGGSVTKPDCSTTSPCTITGLTNGESYTLTVAAINAAGVGPASDASPAIVPVTIPDAVAGLATTPGDTELTVDWTSLTTSQLGGGSFTRYDVSIRVRGQAWSTPITPDGTNGLATRTTNSYTFTGLTNGTAYDVKVVAITSANSSELSSNTTTALGVPATAPAAPTGITLASTSNTSAVASWTAPTDDGGSVITAYSVNLSCTFVNATDTFCTLTGLTAGSRVTVTVGATNLMGTGTTVSAIISMPGGSSGSSGSSDRATPTTTPVVTPNVVTPTLPGTRVLPRPPVQTPRVLNAPVASPTNPAVVNEPARVLVGGRPVPTLTEARGASEVNVRAGKIDLGLGATSPSPTSTVRTNPTTNAPELTVGRGESTSLSVKGLLPGSTLQVWLPGADGRELARIPVNPDGSVTEEIALSATRTETPLPLGRQVLQVTGFDEDGNQTVVDMTINIAQGAPAPEPNRVANELPDLQPGESLATSAGVPEVVTISADPINRQVSISSNDWSFTVVVPEANGTVDVETQTSPTIRLVQQRTAAVTGEGFQPDTRVDIFLFSDPTLLGSFAVNADGSFDAEVYMDQRFAVVGDHTLQIQGIGTDGFVKAANLGVLVDETPAATTATNALGMLWWAAAAFIALLLLIFVFIAVRRGRKLA